MPRRWREPGDDTWLKIVIYGIVAIIIGYFVFRLGGALHRRFHAIKRHYQVVAPSGRASAGLTLRAGLALDQRPARRYREDKPTRLRIKRLRAG